MNTAELSVDQSSGNLCHELYWFRKSARRSSTCMNIQALTPSPICALSHPFLQLSTSFNV